MNRLHTIQWTRAAARSLRTSLRLAVLALITMISAQASGQVSNYTFTQAVGTYTPISGGTTIIAAGTDDGSSAATNIGFTFNFNGSSFTQFVANSNGSIRLGAAAPTSQYTPISTTSNTNAIAGAARDGRSGVQTLLTGSPGSRVLTIEYADFQMTYLNSTNPLAFQIKLYETTNVVQIVYGPRSAATSYTCQVGLRGSTAAADFSNRTTTTDWAASTAGAANTATMTWSTTVMPPVGLTYTWTPPACSPVGPVLTSVGSNSATFSFTPNGALSYDYEIRTSGAPGSGPAGLAASGNVTASPFTVNTLNPATLYTVYMRANCAGPTQSAWSTAVTFATTQIPVTTFPWTVDGTSLAGGQINNTGQTNGWFIGNANGNPAPGLYISSDNGVTNNYNNGAISVSHYYRDIQFPAAGNITFSFNWSIVGEGCCDYLRVYLTPVTFTPTPGTQITAGGTAPTGNIQLIQVNNNSAWNLAAPTIPVAYLGTTSRLIFEWRNDGSLGSPPVAVDNIFLNVQPCVSPVVGQASVVEDCANGLFSIAVPVTNLSGASGITVISDYPGNPGSNGGSTPGTYTVGPFASGSTVNVTVVHNDFPQCNVSVPAISFNCADLGKNALGFDAVDDRVGCGTAPSVDITGNQLTLEAWIYPTSWRTESWRGSIINKEGTTITGYMLRCGNGGQLSFNIGTGSSWVERISAVGALSLNTWQHVAATFDGTNLRIYRDGVELTPVTSTGTVGPIGSTGAGQQLTIGNWSQDNTRGFAGRIDEVRVWAVAKSQAQLQAKMNQLLCGDEAGLRAYYRFDQGVAGGNNAGLTTLTDLTANANNGTLANFALTGGSSNWLQGVTTLAPCVQVTCFDPTNLAVSGNVGNGITLNWTNSNAASYDYEVRSSGAPGSGPAGLAASGNVAGGPVTVTGLTPLTTYIAYVRGACTSPVANSDWVSVGFTTSQIPVSTFPWNVDFSSDPGGQVTSAGQANTWFIGNAAGNPAPGLYITNNGGVSNAYTNTSISVVHVYRDIQFPGAGAITLSFNWSILGESCCDYLRVFMVPASTTPVAGTQLVAGGTAPTGIVQLGQFNNNSAWSNAVISIPAAYLGTTSRLVFEWRNDGSLGSAPVAVDNISLTVGPPPCATLTAPANGTPVEAVNGATLTWSASIGADSYKVYLGTDGGGITLPTNVVNGTDIGNLLTYSTGPLASGQTYYWAVVPTNVFGDASGCTIRNFNTNPPACVATPTSPAVGAVVCNNTALTLSWPASPGATGYDVILDGNTVSANQPGTTYNAGIVGSGPHTWSVVPQNSNGPATGCATWSFSASLLGCYCASGATSTIDEEIYSVTVNGVPVGNQPPGSACTTPAPGNGSILNRYSNWFPLGPVFTVQQGVPASFTVQEDECEGAPYYAFGTAIWIDYNQNGIFEEPAEKVFVENATAVGPRNVTGTFTAPLSSTLGVTAMRVTVAEGISGAGLTPCLSYGYGETEDFLVTIAPPPTPAVATATINNDCDNSTYTITVNVANFGSGTPGNIVYTVNGGSPVTVPATVGANTIPTTGSFAQPGDVVAVSVTNNTVSTLDMGNFYGSCPVVVPCGTTLELSHCYGNNDPRTFTFLAANPGETVTLTFVSGTMDPNDVIRAYSGTDNSGIPIVELTGTFANLGSPQVTGTSLGNALFLEIDSDGSNSCQSGGQTTWNFEVECTPGCVDPDGSATYDLCTQLITVNLDFDGDGASAGIRYIVNGGTPVDITGLNAPYSQDIGPFTPGQSVQVFLLHENDGSCNRNLGVFNIVAPQGQPTVVTNASPAIICAGGSSTLTAVASGGSGPVANYVFQTATGGTLADMSGATQLLGAGADDSGSASTPLGFTLTYGNNPYTNFFVSSNGQMNLGGAAANASLANNLATGTPRPIITCWWDDLHTGSDGYVSTKLFGSPGSYIRVVEWKVRDYPGAGLPTTMLMQAWLYQTGIIELRYGPASAVSDAGASIGISGFNANVFQSVTSTTHTVSTVTENVNNSVWPGEGRIYRWLLPEVPGTTYTWQPGNLSGATQNVSGVNTTTTYTVTATVPGGCPESAQVTVTVNPPITLANITPNPASFCTGGSVTLTATAADGVAPFTYAWTNPNNVAAGSNQTVSANIAGTWTCLVTDACGGTYLASVNVNEVSVPTVNITATAPICVGGSVTLTANVLTGNVTGWLWGGAAPVGGQTGNTVTINSLTAANNGTYTVVGSNNGCNSAAASYALTVNPNPTVSSTTATPNPVCEGSNSVLNVNASLPTSAYCAASTSFTCDESIGNVTFNTINNNSGCSSYTDFTAISTTVSAGTPYPITVTNGGNPYADDLVSVWIDWNRNGLFEGSEQTDLNNVGGTGSLFTGTITPPVNAFNGSTRMRVRMLYFTTPIACGASNYGEVEDYTVVITGGATQLSYLWTGGTFLGGVNNTASVTATSITSATPYSVQVLSGTGCTSTGNVTVNVTPLPTVDCGGPFPTLCVADAPYQLTPVTPGGVWSGTGVTPGGLFNPAVGTQTLTYTVTSLGCSNSCTVTVNVNSADTDGDNIPDCVDQCPNLFGQIGSPCDAGPGYILGVIDANCNCVGVPCTEDVRLQVSTDANGGQTSFEVREASTNLLVCSGGPFTGINNAEYTQDCCLPEGCYNLIVFDSAGDGIVGGGYVLREANGNQRRIIDNSGNFTNGFTSQISDSPGFCVPLGQDRLIFTSCDKLDWKTSPCGGEFVVANDNPVVTAEYGVNNANSGYQMWFYNPNGGYSFKRFQSHSTNNGLPASATRACHFQLNSWSGNQLQQGVMYNVKVRGRVNGDYLPWGPACRLMVDDVAAQCPRTKLMDIPNNAFLSCGQTRAVSNTVYVHARPVRRMNANCNWVNANRYQFRFRIPSENVTIIKTAPVGTGNYFVNTAGLACNKTYEVEVRVSFDGGATWCHGDPNPNVTSPKWGDVCLVTTTCGNAMAQQGGDLATDAAVRMFPNPNRGDLLTLSISSVEEGVQTVTVDVFDAYGKRAMARTIPVQDGFVNTVLDLSGEMANGLYMVSITAGSRTYNERLVIQK